MTIGYSKTFPVFGKDQWEKVWLEDEMMLNIQADATDEEIEEIMKKVRRIQYALKAQVELFFYESKAAAEKQMGTHLVDAGQKDEIFNQEWEDIKRQLLSFDNAEAAQLYLNSTSYSMTIEAKQIINTLKNKHEKK